MTFQQRRDAPRQQGQRGGPQPGGSRGEEVTLPSRNDIEKIIVNGEVDALVTWADKVGKRLKDENLSTSQIRNVFGTVRQIQLRWDKPGGENELQAFRDAVLLQPKLGYFAQREAERGGQKRTEGMRTLESVLTPALEMVRAGKVTPEVNERFERFQRFADFFEAIVAYHKKHGGKEN